MTLALFSRTPFSHLRHLTVVDSEPPAVLQLLRLLPALESLTINSPLIANYQTFQTFFTAVANAAPPSLAVLRVEQARIPYAALAFVDLRRSVSSPERLQGLPQLHLPDAFRAQIDDGAWAEFEEGCEWRSLGVFVV